MMRRCFPRACGVALVVALLAACATQPPPPPPPPPPIDTVALVAQIRAAAGPDDAKDELAIRPLRDPMVEDLRMQAARLETEGKYAEAAAALDQALTIVSDDPALVQERAEAAIYAGQFGAAAAFALQAYGMGAQVGPLCRRHWATIRIAREQQHDVAGANAATQQFGACKVTAPPRY